MKILLIITGSVAAYKSCDLIRRLKEKGHEVKCILTSGGAQFVTPLLLSSLSGSETYGDLFSLKDEVEMGHIRLSRESDVIVVAPATADIMARIANGMADDLATATILASDKPVYVAPAMNVEMWKKPATQRNLALLTADGIKIIEPASGKMACNEEGQGRMADVDDIIKAIVK